MCLEYLCHGDDCEFYKTGTGSCHCDMMDTGSAECMCTWSYKRSWGGCCYQEWDGYYPRGKLDDIDSVIGVWGLLDVVENFREACLQEAREWSHADKYFSEFYEETEATFKTKIDAIIKLLQEHSDAVWEEV